MKKTLAVLSILALTLPAAAREFNDLGDFRREMRERRIDEPRAAERTGAPPALDVHGCAVMNLDDVVISRGVFSSDFKIEAGGSKIGEIETGGSGYAIKAGSAVAARASGSVVTDCSGAVIGSVEENAGEDASSFTIKDASGRIVAASGQVDGSSMILKGAGGMVAVSNNHWLLDSYRVSVSGVDARLAAMAVVMNNAAGYRRAAQRRRDNPHEPRGGRGDR